MRWMLVFFVAFTCLGCKRTPSEATMGETHAVTTIDAAAVAQLTVDVRADGTLALNGATVKDENELTERTRELARDKPVLHAVIHVDKGVAYDRVIAAERALKQGGVAHMSFAAFGAPIDASLP
jgi:biopolymer transport protein ExbD